jgi:uncharacterized lipoprotein YmbA
LRDFNPLIWEWRPTLNARSDNLLNKIVWAIRLTPELTSSILSQMHQLLPGPEGAGTESSRGFKHPAMLVMVDDRASGNRFDG